VDRIVGLPVHGQWCVHGLLERDPEETGFALVAQIGQGEATVADPVRDPLHQIPAELLNPDIGFLRAEEHAPDALAARLAAKVRRTKTAGGDARDFGAAVSESNRRAVG
jgi:hypothetical protein